MTISWIGGMPFFSGDAFDVENLVEPAKGYFVQVNVGQVPVVIVGSHNPDVTVWPIARPVGSQGLKGFSLPYHTTWVTSQDVLQNAWDNQTGTNDLNLSLAYFELDPGAGADFNSFVGQTVVGIGSPDPLWTGDPFNLIPGDGYLFQLNQGGANLQMPHY
jgi:hypothetical protein